MSLPGPGAKSPLPAFGQRVVDISGLVVRRGGNLALSGFEFEAREGEVVALVGSNGSGKTTVLRTIAGLLTAEAGRVFVGRSGASGASFSLRSRDIGLLPQNASSLFFLDTVAQDLAYAPAASPGTVAELDPSLMSGLSGFLDRHPLDLSAGQRQWLGLALIERARPRLLLLDEPTRGLHASDRQRLGVYLRRRSAQGATVVIASHDWRFVADFADSFYELDKGRVIRLGAASQLVA